MPVNHPYSRKRRKIDIEKEAMKQVRNPNDNSRVGCISPGKHSEHELSKALNILLKGSK